MARIWKQRVFNYVRMMYIDPCDPNRNIYAEMALDAVYRGIISYAEPGWKDIIDLTTGGSWVKHGSRKLKEARVLGSSWAGPTGEILIPLAEGLDRIAWLVMVLETLFEVFISWGSAAYQVSPCEEEPTYLWWTSHNPEMFSSQYDEYVLGPAWPVEQGNVGDYVSSRINVPTGWKGYVLFAAKFEKFIGFGEVTSYKTRVVTQTGRVIKENTFIPTEANRHQGPIIFVPFDGQFTPEWIEFQVSVAASDHRADFFAYEGICQGSFRSPDTPFRKPPFNKTGYHFDISAVND